jgi:hypothetical protein
MQAVIRLSISELNEKLIATLKNLYGNRDVEITISDVSPKAKPKKYKTIIDERIQKVEEGKQLIYLDMSDLKKLL